MPTTWWTESCYHLSQSSFSYHQFCDHLFDSVLLAEDEPSSPNHRCWDNFLQNESLPTLSLKECMGIDYAGPFPVKYGSVRKPTVVKAYLCIFVSLTVKAVHLELVSDLTSEAFIAALRRFIARRGYPTLLWSDQGTNFVGANRETKEFNHFLQSQIAQGTISEFCSTRNIEWKFIPEHSPHFGGLWESTVKSVKTHLQKIVGTV